MQDEKIAALYWQRDEAAIRETKRKYGPYLSQIAYRILLDAEDSEEAVNDTYWKAWSSIPPHKPCVLAAYLGKITRQLSIDKLRTRKRDKRQASEYALSLSELEECVSGGDTTEQGAALNLLAEAISAYLRQLPPETRRLFVRRYYYLDSIKEAAACCRMSESKAKSMLHRTRTGLKAYLEQEGFEP